MSYQHEDEVDKCSQKSLSSRALEGLEGGSCSDTALELLPPSGKEGRGQSAADERQQELKRDC